MRLGYTLWPIVVYAQPPKNFTHGDILRWRRVGGLILAEVQYEPGQRVHRHVHPHARFVLVLAGGDHRDSRRRHADATAPRRCCSGAPASRTPTSCRATGATCLIVDVDDEWHARATAARAGAASSRPRFAAASCCISRIGCTASSGCATRCRAWRSRASRSACWPKRRAAAREGERASGAGVARGRRARSSTQHFAEAAAARRRRPAVGVHPVHLARTFRRVHQITLRRVRPPRAHRVRAPRAGRRRARRWATSPPRPASAIRAISPACSSATPARRPPSTACVQ